MSQTGYDLQNGILEEVFNAVLMDAPGELLDGISTFYLSLHSSFPGDGGPQTSGEIAYTSYARTAVTRAAGSGGFRYTAVGSKVDNNGTISFPQCTGGDVYARYLGIGTAASGAGSLLAYAPIVSIIDSWFYGIADAAADTIACAVAHFGGDPVLAVGNEIHVAQLYNESATPGGALTVGTPYYIRSGYPTGTWPAKQTIQLTATAGGGGAAVNLTSENAFQLIRVTPLHIYNLVTPTLPDTFLQVYGS